VDTGDLLYPGFPTEDSNVKKMGELKADLFMKTYNLMGYDAFTPGEFDLAFGVENLIRMSRQANFPFLAANLLNSKTKKPVFKPYIIKEVQGGKVGLLGLISKRLPLGMGAPPEKKGKFHLADPIETAKKIVPLLKKKCKLIAVLGHMEKDEQEMLAKACPDIFFILSGHVPQQQPNPIRASNSQIFTAGSRGEHLGQVDFLFEGKNLYARYQLIALNRQYADHPQVKEWLDQYKTDLQNSTQTLPPAGLQNEPGDEPKQ
jgi:2',3'-cyclic-nucleotide 2'-phosphodiesterase (5'-nucleotidase family)